MESIAAITKITLDEAIRLDPEIGVILAGLKRRRSERLYYEEYTRAKRRLEWHVGWYAREGTPEVLMTPEAYDVVLAEAIRRIGGERA